jgi:hypothetical protein
LASSGLLSFKPNSVRGVNHRWARLTVGCGHGVVQPRAEGGVVVAAAARPVSSRAMGTLNGEHDT